MFKFIGARLLGRKNTDESSCAGASRKKQKSKKKKKESKKRKASSTSSSSSSEKSFTIKSKTRWSSSDSETSAFNAFLKQILATKEEEAG